MDHLVKGSKESRIADGIVRSPIGAHVRIVGHPFIDIWQAVKPDRLGLRAWPTIPRNIEWKKGVCQHLGWPHRDQADIARAWQHILSKVKSYDDLEPALLGRVEELIDFVTIDSVGDGSVADAAVLARHEDPQDDVGEDLRPGQQDRQHGDDPDHGRVPAEAAGDAGADAADHAALAGAVEGCGAHVTDGRPPVAIAPSGSALR